MKINRDDPKWTAYVLGELNEAENAGIAQLLESSKEAREFVEDLRLATTMLKDEFAQIPAPALLPEQHRAIRAAVSHERPRWFAVRPAIWAAALAASVLVMAALTLPSFVRSRRASAQLPEIATNIDTIGPATGPAAANRTPPYPRFGAIPNPPATPPTASPTVRPTLQDEEKLQAPQEAQKAVDVARSQTSDSVSVSIQRQENAVAPASLPTPPPPSSARFRIADEVKAIETSSGPGIGGVITPPLQNFDQAFVLPIVPDRPGRPVGPPFNTEAYDRITDNPFVRVNDNPLSTFSIDVDTASYANMRRFLTQGQMPPKDSVRIEEMVNYFSYDYPRPTGEHPIAAQMEVASAPWNPQHRLVRIAIKGREMDAARRPSTNLVFLIDVSGSMQPPEKLPLLKSAMKLLVDKLTENDRVSIVVYAGASGTALPPTSGDKKEVIMDAIDSLRANGSTNGASGIQLAYELAVSNFIRGGVNRVILATDGDFNVGVTNQGDLVRLIEDKAKSGVFLSVFGFGMGNLKDSTLEKLADTGNGNYAYIDSINEARKVLVEEMGATLITIAKDVKIQIEFNPAQVNAYRLIGYENRLLRNQDFNDDQKDAGDMGSGHTVTALFEVVPPGVDVGVPGVDPLKYQAAAAPAARATSNREMLNLKIRYKDPDGSQSKLFETPLVDRGASFLNASTDFRFAASVAAFGMILRDSPYKGDVGVDAILGMAQQSRGADRGGYRDEFISLVRRARAIGGIK